MACGCHGGRTAQPNRLASGRVRPTPAPVPRAAPLSTPQAVTAGAKVWYEVWRGGRYTGRRSDSLIAAQQTADRLGGEVRPSS